MSALSIIGGALTGALGLAVKLLRLKRVTVPPLLDGPVHVYPGVPGASWYQERLCSKCGLYNARRAAYTQPPCSEKLPSIVVELP